MRRLLGATVIAGVLALLAVPVLGTATHQELLIPPLDHVSFSFTMAENDPLHATWSESSGKFVTIYLMTEAQHAAYPGVTDYEWSEGSEWGTFDYTREHAPGTYYLVFVNGYGMAFLNVTVDYTVGVIVRWDLILALILIGGLFAVIIVLSIKGRHRVAVSYTQTATGGVFTNRTIDPPTCPNCRVPVNGKACPVCGWKP